MLVLVWFEKWCNGDEFVTVGHDLSIEFDTGLCTKVSLEVVSIKPFTNVTVFQTLPLRADGFRLCEEGHCQQQ